MIQPIPAMMTTWYCGMKFSQVVKRIGENCGVKINWEEIKHVMKFTFMGQNGKLQRTLHII